MTTGLRWTPEQLADHLARKEAGPPAIRKTGSAKEGYRAVYPKTAKEIYDALNPAKPSKFHAVLTECDGIKFQSKKEAAYFRELQARVHMGEVAYFLRQVPFDLIGGVKYRVDFMECLKDGTIRYVDVKGYRTQTYKMKRRMVEASYPVKIVEV